MSASWEIRCGDCIDLMGGMPEASVDAIVTDPPYGISFMGKTWDKFGGPLGHDHHDGRERSGSMHAGEYDLRPSAMGAFQAWCDAWGREALRVLKPGGHAVVSGGTRTFHRLTCGLEDAGFEIRDCLMWLFGSGFPKSRNLDGDWQGWGTALKPAWEPIVLARKPLAGTVAANVAEYGTGAINIGGCRLAPRGTVQVQGAESRDGTTVYGAESRSGGAVYAADLGRWPANVILDESAAHLVDEQSGDTASSVTRVLRRGVSTGRGMGYGSSSPSQAADIGYSDQGGASRFMYCAKTSKEERNRGLDGFTNGRPRESGHVDGRTWDIPGSKAKPRRNDHPTVKPVELMRWLVRLITPPGGIVLDPFAGSGTTGIAALREGFSFLGIERDEHYCDIARARIVGDAPLLNGACEVAA